MTSRLLNLDALRGIAAFLVVWQHSSELFVRNPDIAQRGTLLADIAATVDFGRIGVICFFLISGFVIPYSLSGPRASVGRFAIRRVFRLYPVYWTSIILAVVCAAALNNQHFPTATIVANTTMLQGLFGFENIQGLYWTLTIELIFYCLCAATFALRLLDRPLSLLLLCWGSLFVFVAWRLVGKLIPAAVDFPSPITYTPYCLAVMFCGALIRYCHTNRSGYLYALLGLSATFAIPLCLLMLALLGIHLIEGPIRFGSAHLIALAVFLIVLLVPKTPPRMLVFFGTISYSLYLFHPVAMQVLRWTMQQDWGQFLSGHALGFYISITAGLTIIIAWTMYRLVEQPSIDMGRALSKSRASIRTSTA